MTDLAHAVVEIAESGKSKFHYLYESHLSLADKVRVIATEIYRAKSVEFPPSVLKSCVNARSVVLRNFLFVLQKPKILSVMIQN